MNRPWLIHALGVLCLIVLPAQIEGAVLGTSSALWDVFRSDDEVWERLPDDPSVSSKMLEVMRESQLRYQEGADLIRLRKLEPARASFNSAVDLVLESEWSLESNPSLDRFFQDLIRRIQQDELRYHQSAEETADIPEAAVVDQLEKLDLIPITVDPSLQDTVIADLASTEYDVPILLNEKVLKSLNFWLKGGRKSFSDGLVRSGRYREMIGRIFREESIPLDIMYLAQVESLFKTNALSRKQCKGIWQFGKGTAIRYGLKVNSTIDERSDPEKSTRAAARYLNDLYAMFKDWHLVLAAYNWGEGKVQRLMNRSGLKDFWEIMDLRRNFPKETKNHVPLIMASVILGRNPTKYGLPTELDLPLTYDRVRLSKPVDLRSAAKVLDVPVEHLKQLNPALRRFSTPAGYANFELKIPLGMGPILEQRLAALQAVRPEPVFAGKHRVRAGDTLSEIASRYRVSVASLQDANDLKSAKSLRAGMWLQVPSTNSAAAKPAVKLTRAAFSSPLRPIEASRLRTSKQAGLR